MNDNTNDPTLLVSGVLQASRDHLNTEQIAKRVALSSQQITAALKQLARQGQIEVLPAGTRRPARYGWLASTPPAAEPAAEPRELTPEAQAERDDFSAEYGSGNCSCHISPPRGSCTHPGNPRNQDDDETAWQRPAKSTAPATSATAPVPTPAAARPAEPLTRYLVVAHKRKPRVVKHRARAEDLAMAAVRRGARRAEVFKLVPVGHARRGADWVEP